MNAHRDAVSGLKVDPIRGYLYSIGKDKKLCVIDLRLKKVLVHLKTANAKMKAVQIDYCLKRLYASSIEGQIFIFNISGITPILLHSFTLDTELGYVHHIELDPIRNMMICLTKYTLQAFSALLFIQLDSKNEKDSKVVAVVPNRYMDSLKRVAWLSRMEAYFVGTDKGKLRVFDTANQCMMFLPQEFPDKVSCMHYC